MSDSSLVSSSAQLWRKLRIPAHATLELTPRCNLDCRMCYIHLTPQQMGDRRELTAGQWIQIIDDAVENGLLHVLLSGGECMMHPGFWEIYTHLREKGTVVAVNTNCLMMTEENVARFREMPPSHINVTVYGASEAGYARCTGHRVFGRVKENLERLVAAGLLPSISITGSRYNKEEIPAIAAFAASLHLPVRMEMNLTEAREDTGRKLESFLLTPRQRMEVFHYFRRKAGREAVLPEKPYPEIPPLQPDDPDYHNVSCGAGKSAYVIFWDGAMAPCFDMRTDPPLYPLELGVKACWEECLKWIAAYPSPVECRDCPLRLACDNCVTIRNDPRNPGHRNPEVCRMTFLKYNEGLVNEKGEAVTAMMKQRIEEF